MARGRTPGGVCRAGNGKADVSENIDLTIGSFDDPSRFTPHHRFGAESIHEGWLDTRDLPRYCTDEHKPLIERWMATVGKLPD